MFTSKKFIDKKVFSRVEVVKCFLMRKMRTYPRPQLQLIFLRDYLQTVKTKPKPIIIRLTSACLTILYKNKNVHFQTYTFLDYTFGTIWAPHNVYLHVHSIVMMM